MEVEATHDSFVTPTGFLRTVRILRARPAYPDTFEEDANIALLPLSGRSGEMDHVARIMLPL